MRVEDAAEAANLEAEELLDGRERTQRCRDMAGNSKATRQVARE